MIALPEEKDAFWHSMLGHLTAESKITTVTNHFMVRSHIDMMLSGLLIFYIFHIVNKSYVQSQNNNELIHPQVFARVSKA